MVRALPRLQKNAQYHQSDSRFADVSRRCLNALQALGPMTARNSGFLQPCPCPAAHVPRAYPLRNDAFEPQPAGMAEHGGAVAGERLAELDAFPRSITCVI